MKFLKISIVLASIILGSGLASAGPQKNWNWKLVSGIRKDGFFLHQDTKNKKSIFKADILFDGEVIKTTTLSSTKFGKANQLLLNWLQSTNSFDHTMSICRSPIRLSFSSRGRSSHKSFCPDLMSPSEMKEFDVVQAEVRKVILSR